MASDSRQSLAKRVSSILSKPFLSMCKWASSKLLRGTEIQTMNFCHKKAHNTKGFGKFSMQIPIPKVFSIMQHFRSRLNKRKTFFDSTQLSSISFYKPKKIFKIENLLRNICSGAPRIVSKPQIGAVCFNSSHFFLTPFEPLPSL